MLFQTGVSDNQLNAALQGGVGEGHEACTDAAPGAGTRLVCDIGVEIALNDLGKMFQIFVELRDHFGRRALLLAIDVRGTVFTA